MHLWDKEQLFLNYHPNKNQKKKEKTHNTWEQLLHEAETTGSKARVKNTKFRKCIFTQNKQFGNFLAAAIRIFELTILWPWQMLRF